MNKSLKRVLKHILKRIKYLFLWPYYYIKLRVTNYPKIIILGNQKAGTSIIAKLLSVSSKSSFASNPFDITKIENKKYNNNIHKFKIKYPHAFSYKILKENSLIFKFDEILTQWPYAQYVFIVRHPVDNLRSILDRCGISMNDLPLTKDEISAYRIEPKEWKEIINGKDLSLEILNKNNYIHKLLAYRWKMITQIYLTNRNKFLLVRYEDFSSNKSKYIDELNYKLNLVKKINIGNYVNVNYGPKGKHRGRPINELFPDNVIKEVEEICSAEMEMLGYLFYSNK